MSRLSAVLLALLLLTAGMPASPVAAAGPWTLDASTGRVALDFRSADLTADEVEFTIEDRTGLVLLVGEEMAYVLELLGLRTGYSQVATWQSGEGPLIACPALGSNVWCSSDAGSGLALVPNPGRAILLAQASEAPGHAELTVMVGDASLAFDLAVVAVGMGLSVVVPHLPDGVPTSLVIDAALQVLPESMAAADAFLAGNLDAATMALAAAGLAAAEVLIDHAAEWEVALGLALATKLVPWIATVELMLAAAKAVPAVFTLVAAMGNDEQTTVRVGWSGIGETAVEDDRPTATTTPSPGTVASGSTCEPDPDFMTAEQVTRALPEVIGGKHYRKRVYDVGSEQVGDVSRLWPSAQHQVEFVIAVTNHLNIWRVSGACAEDFPDAFARAMSASGDPTWVPRWKAITHEGEPLWVTRPPDDLDFAPAAQVWVRGDVGVLAYDLDAAELGRLLTNLRSAGAEPETPPSLSVGTGPIFARLTDEQPADEHRLDAEEGDQVGIWMDSPDFDAYLRVIGPDGSVLAENDDAPAAGRSRTDSYVQFAVATTGEHTVVASSYEFMTNTEPYGVGEYQLQLSAVTGVVQTAGDPQEQHTEGAGGFVRIVHQGHEFYFDSPTCVMDIDGTFLRIREGSAPTHAVQLTIGRNRTEDLRPGGRFPLSGLDWWEGLRYGDQTPRGGSVKLDEGGMSGSFEMTWWGGTAYGDFRCP